MSTAIRKMTESALNTLEELIARYPDSKYARDAKVKVDLTFDHLAGKTMQIGRYLSAAGPLSRGGQPFQVSR